MRCRCFFSAIRSNFLHLVRSLDSMYVDFVVGKASRQAANMMETYLRLHFM